MRKAMLTPILLLALAVPAGARGEAAPEVSFVSVPTSTGAFGVAFRPLGPTEREGGRTHEFLFAHPIWAHGVRRALLTLDCQAMRKRNVRNILRLWSGGEPVRHRTEFAPVVWTFALFDARRAPRIVQEIGCNPGRYRARRMTREAAGRELLRIAGPHVQPWRLAVVNFEKRKASAAFPAEPERFSYPPAFVGADYRQQGLKLERDGIELSFFAEVIGDKPWPSTGALYDHYFALAKANKPQKIFEVAHTKYRSLAGVVEHRGLYTVARIVVCKEPNPRVAYTVSGEYRNKAQEIAAWRFVNSMQVDC